MGANHFDAVDLGLKYCRISRKPVPITEDEFRALSEDKKVQCPPGGWVRLLKGGYKNDLAYVLQGSEERKGVTVAVVPRIRMQAEQICFDENNCKSVLENSKKRKAADAKPRPLAALFDDALIRRYYGTQSVVSQGDSFIFEKRTYHRGLLIITVQPHVALTLESSPSTDALIPFAESCIDPRRVDLCLSRSNWRKGDVLILRGENFDGTKCELVSLHNDVQTATVRLIRVKGDVLGQDMLMEVSFDRLCRAYDLGDVVIVIAGRHSGRRGMISQISDDMISIIEDVTLLHVSIYL